jgi:hypothetical protein
VAVPAVSSPAVTRSRQGGWPALSLVSLAAWLAAHLNRPVVASR